MGVSVTSTSIRVDGGNYTFEEIANEINNTSIMLVTGNYVRIYRHLYIRDSAYVNDVNKMIELDRESGSNEDLLQIEKGSTLHLGTIDSDGVITGGCTLNIPNIKIKYGFGNETISNSGNFFAYGCSLNIPGFWGFFEGTNHVEIISTRITGWGRVSGPNSILKNSPVVIGHGRYGGISTKGQILEAVGNDVDSVDEYTNTEFGSIKCAIYFNPILAGNLRKVGETYRNCTRLAYIENTGGADNLTLVDCDIQIPRDLAREDNSGINVYEKYTFDFIVQNELSSKLIGVSVNIKNKHGDTVAHGTTDSDGRFSTELIYWENILSGSNTSNIDFPNPYTLELSHNGIESSDVYVVDKPLKNLPIVLKECSGGSGGECDLTPLNDALSTLQANIINTINSKNNEVIDHVTFETSQVKTEVCECVETKGSSVSNDLGVIIQALDDSVDESIEMIKVSADVTVIA